MINDYSDAKARVLHELKQAAPKFLTTWKLIERTRHSRAAGRIWELIHKDGYRIEHKHAGRIHMWRYVGEPEQRQVGLF